MSDDGVVNLEDDGPAIEADAAPAPEPATEPATEPAPAADPDGDRPAEVEAVEVAGQKYVPVSVLKAEREKRQQLAPLAQRAQQLEAWAQANKPYIDFLQANPDFLKPRQAEPAPAPADPTPDPAALELAKSLDLYDASGQPDLARAAKIQGLMAMTAEQKAQALVQPFQEQQTQRAAVENYQRVVAFAQQSGVDKGVVDFLWQESAKQGAEGMRLWANPDNARSLALMAIGAHSAYQQQHGKAAPPAVKPPEPVFTEASGGNPRSRPTLSGLEGRVAKERGMTETQWSENLRGFKPGATNVLED